MRTLEKSLTTSHPFHAKLVCHWPQINYQETGREQMWPTPNWLHQHSLRLLILFPSCFTSLCSVCPLKRALLSLHQKISPVSITVLKLTFTCVLHITSAQKLFPSSAECSLVSLCKLCVPPEMQSHEISRGLTNTTSTPLWVVEFEVWMHVELWVR